MIQTLSPPGNALAIRLQKYWTMNVRRFQLGEELAIFEGYCSAIHLIARNDYSEEQPNTWPLIRSATAFAIAKGLFETIQLDR